MQVDIKSLESPKVGATSKAKSKKPIAMNLPPKLQAQRYEEHHLVEAPKNHFVGYLPDELKDNVKNVVLKGLSLPVKSRSAILQHKLQHSDYINKYLNRYLILDNIALLNDHAKFGLVYGFNVLETLMMDIRPLQQAEEKKAKQSVVMKESNNEQNVDSLNPSN